MSAYRRTVVWAGLGLLVGVLLFAFRPSARALPEYMARTGEACATCHVNPAGGGALTARGSLWVAEGRPDQVPLLPSADQSAPPQAEGPDLYAKFGCDLCHGSAGEGAAGPALNRGALSADELSRITRDGKDGMPGYQADTISDADLAVLVSYLQGIGRSNGPPQADDKPKAAEPAPAVCGNGSWLGDRSLYACDGN